jgi:hypothetical protein
MLNRQHRVTYPLSAESMEAGPYRVSEVTLLLPTMAVAAPWITLSAPRFGHLVVYSCSLYALLIKNNSGNRFILPLDHRAL